MYDCHGAPGSDVIVSGTCVVGAVGRHAGDLLELGDLIELFRQDGCITDCAGGDLDYTDLQGLLITGDVDLTPVATLGAAVFPALPFTFTLHIARCAVDQAMHVLFEIPGSFLKDKAERTAAEAEAWSPLTAERSAWQQWHITCGALETRPFHGQSGDFAQNLRQREAAVTGWVKPGMNHLNIVLALADPS